LVLGLLVLLLRLRRRDAVALLLLQARRVGRLALVAARLLGDEAAHDERPQQQRQHPACHFSSPLLRSFFSSFFSSLLSSSFFSSSFFSSPGSPGGRVSCCSRSATSFCSLRISSSSPLALLSRFSTFGLRRRKSSVRRLTSSCMFRSNFNCASGGRLSSP